MTQSLPKKDHSLIAGAGIAAAAAALVAGAYFLYGRKDSSARRQKIKGWVLKMKGEVLEQIEHLKEINEHVYSQIVDTVGQQYARVKDIDADDVAKVVSELKQHWGDIQKQLNKKAPTVKKTTTPRKTAKKQSKS